VVFAFSFALSVCASEAGRSTDSSDQNSGFSVSQLLLGIGSGAAFYLSAPYLPLLSKCAVATKLGIRGGKKIKGLISPSEEWQLQQEVAIKKREIDVAQNKLDDCLLTYKESAHDSLGIPIPCREQCSNLFITYGRRIP
jgi:hypothetical protein